MRFASYAPLGADSVSISYGLLLDSGDMLDLPRAAACAGATTPGAGLLAFIADGAPSLALAKQLAERATDPALAPALLTPDGFRLLAPIPRPAKNVFCVGRNYKDHVAEGYRTAGTEVKLPEVPQFFTKPPTAVIGTDDVFYLDPKVTKRLDYEVELAVIIGTAGRDIPADQAWSHVFGFSILNDITARDLQRRHEQWFKGKGLDRSCPMGPIILTRDRVADPGALELSLTVDGERRQHATVSQMIFDIPTIIASLSAGLTLEPGDIIATGTPSGVGYAMTPPHYLAGGNEVVCEITGLGRLVTRIEEVA
jgi:2-keto-4-pentenoate hydratase/2-oxohepta-3-ene-1,7-dioic acid hydratase in catechol pathway